MKDSDPDRFAQQVIDLLNIFEPIRKMERGNPELAETMKKNIELQKRRDSVLLQIRITPNEEQGKLIEELKLIISERFDTIVLEKQLYHEWMQRRLKYLEKKIETRAKELESLKQTKDQSVEARLNELVERTEKVNWN